MSDTNLKIEQVDAKIANIETDLKSSRQNRDGWNNWGGTLMKSSVVLVGLGYTAFGALSLGGITLAPAMIDVAQKVAAIVFGLVMLLSALFMYQSDAASKEVKRLEGALDKKSVKRDELVDIQSKESLRSSTSAIAALVAALMVTAGTSAIFTHLKG